MHVKTCNLDIFGIDIGANIAENALNLEGETVLLTNKDELKCQDYAHR
jgi:hypothetical protein